MDKTEITVQVFESLNDIQNKLISLGFEIIDDYIMQDYYFSPLSTEILKQSSYETMINNSFLLRFSENRFSLLIYKQKTFDKDGNVIQEEKITSNVEDIEKCSNIFKLSGLNNWCNLTQRLIICKKDNLEFAIQCIDDLGIFIEYEEDDNVTNLPLDEKIETMKNTLSNLELKLGNDFFCKKVYMKFLNSYK